MAIFSRYLFSELLVISRGITFNKLCQGSHNVQAVRTLYAANSLGLDNYINIRGRIETQFANISERFRTKMLETIEPNCKNMVFTEDLKNMLHLVQPGDKKDLDLVMIMLKRYNEQNKELRFGSYTFGPVIMRMLHFLNEPSIALEVFQSPELSGLFDNVTSYHVFMDLLYKAGRYQDILDVMQIIKNKQLQGAKFPKNCVLLTFASCYKMNTPESFKYSIDLWKQLQQVGHVPLRRTTTFAAALALKQNSPDIALEMLSIMGQNNYVTVRTIKLNALTDIGRPEDTFPILRSIFERDDPKIQKSTISEELCEKIKASVAASGNQDSIREFEELEKNLRGNGNIVATTSLDALLCKEIVTSPDHRRGLQQRVMDASYNNRQRPNNSTWKSFDRPGLRDLD